MAGIQTAQNIIKTGADILITGNCGPKALYELHSEKIKVFDGAIDSIKQVIEDYRRGMLKEVYSADVKNSQRKGGTGKTTISAALSVLPGNETDNSKVFADCDVDAADLHLLLKPEVIEKHEFSRNDESCIR
jgi:hypothetical protein